MLFLDDADLTYIFKDKGKLNRIIKKYSIAHVTFLFSFEIQYLFVNFIFVERMFLGSIQKTFVTLCGFWPLRGWVGVV